MNRKDAYSTTAKLRIGPRMQQAYDYVRKNPDCTKYAVARAIGPHGSQFYGWRALQRAIEAGMILAVKEGDSFKLRAVPIKTLVLI